MRNVIIFSFFLLLSIVELGGQTNRPIGVGLKAGICYYDIYGTNHMNELSGIVGYTPYFSLFLNYKLAPKFTLGVESIYNWSEDWHFIEIPIYVKYKLLNRVYIFAGPKLDILVYEFFEGDSKNLVISTDVGLEVYLTKRIFLECRYSYGLQEQLYDPYDFDLGRRNTIRAGIGIHF